MKLRLWRLVAVPLVAWALLAVVPADLRARSPERHKWWLSEEVRAEVELTPQQSQELEAIFQSVLPRLRSGWQDLERLEQEVTRLMTEGETDEARVEAAVDRTEAARATLNKTRTLMSFRMYRVLSPGQRVKLKAFHERSRERRAPAPSSARQ